MTLMDLFFRLRHPWRLQVAAVHVQHGIRGNEAEMDEAFVGEASRQYGFPFFSLYTDARNYSRLKKVSLETGCRELRYAFLGSVLDRTDYVRIAVAHHADDQAETILLNLVRGSGLKGLGGMLPRRGNIIRPLLFAPREEIEAYSRSRGIVFRTDRTNRDQAFRRNRMRWRVLAPLKRNFGDHVVSSICRAGLAATEASQVIEHEASKRFHRLITCSRSNEIELDIHLFLNYFKGIQKEILIQLFQSALFIQTRTSFHELERVLDLAENGKSGAVLNLGSGVSIVKSGNRLVWKKESNRLPVHAVEIGRNMDLDEAGIRFASTVMKWYPGKPIKHDDPGTAFLDYDVLNPPFFLRYFQRGDWFMPLGMEGKKKLQDFFVDQKIPVYRRSQIPLFISNGDIAWICGFRVDERFKVTARTKRVLMLATTNI